MFWIVATHARCMAVLESDGPTQLADALEPGFRALLADHKVYRVVLVTI